MFEFDKNKPFYLKTTYSVKGGYRYYFKQDENKPFKRISKKSLEDLKNGK